MAGWKLVAITLLVTLAAPAIAGEVREVPHGMIVTTDTGEQVRVLTHADGTFRVTVGTALPERRPTAMVVDEADGTPQFLQQGEIAYLVSPQASAALTLTDGRLTVYDPQGAVLLDEYAPACRLTPIAIEGQPWRAARVQFNRGTDEGLYRLG